MKQILSTVCLALCVAVLAAPASAQQSLNFADLPLVDMPSPMPSDYGQLNWANFFYVNPYGWPGAGPGYQLGPQGADVAFIGGEACRLSGYSCFGTLNNLRGFQLVSAIVAGGYGPTQVTVSAYNNGRFLGRVRYVITSRVQTLSFPSSWGIATEVVFQVTGQPGNLVVYGLSVYTLGG